MLIEYIRLLFRTWLYTRLLRVVASSIPSEEKLLRIWVSMVGGDIYYRSDIRNFALFKRLLEMTESIPGGVSDRIWQYLQGHKVLSIRPSFFVRICRAVVNAFANKIIRWAGLMDGLLQHDRENDFKLLCTAASSDFMVSNFLMHFYQAKQKADVTGIDLSSVEVHHKGPAARFIWPMKYDGRFFLKVFREESSDAIKCYDVILSDSVAMLHSNSVDSNRKQAFCFFLSQEQVQSFAKSDVIRIVYFVAKKFLQEQQSINEFEKMQCLSELHSIEAHSNGCFLTYISLFHSMDSRSIFLARADEWRHHLVQSFQGIGVGLQCNDHDVLIDLLSSLPSSKYLKRIHDVEPLPMERLFGIITHEAMLDGMSRAFLEGSVSSFGRLIRYQDSLKEHCQSISMRDGARERFLYCGDNGIKPDLITMMLKDPTMLHLCRSGSVSDLKASLPGIVDVERNPALGASLKHLWPVTVDSQYHPICTVHSESNDSLVSFEVLLKEASILFSTQNAFDVLRALILGPQVDNPGAAGVILESLLSSDTGRRWLLSRIIGFAFTDEFCCGGFFPCIINGSLDFAIGSRAEVLKYDGQPDQLQSNSWDFLLQGAIFLPKAPLGDLASPSEGIEAYCLSGFLSNCCIPQDHYTETFRSLIAKMSGMACLADSIKDRIRSLKLKSPIQDLEGFLSCIEPYIVQLLGCLQFPNHNGHHYSGIMHYLEVISQYFADCIVNGQESGMTFLSDDACQLLLSCVLKGAIAGGAISLLQITACEEERSAPLQCLATLYGLVQPDEARYDALSLYMEKKGVKYSDFSTWAIILPSLIYAPIITDKGIVIKSPKRGHLKLSTLEKITRVEQFIVIFISVINSLRLKFDIVIKCNAHPDYLGLCLSYSLDLFCFWMEDPNRMQCAADVENALDFWLRAIFLKSVSVPSDYMGIGGKLHLDLFAFFNLYVINCDPRSSSFDSYTSWLGPSLFRTGSQSLKVNFGEDIGSVTARLQDSNAELYEMFLSAEKRMQEGNEEGVIRKPSIWPLIVSIDACKLYWGYDHSEQIVAFVQSANTQIASPGDSSACERVAAVDLVVGNALKIRVGMSGGESICDTSLYADLLIILKACEFMQARVMNLRHGHLDLFHFVREIGIAKGLALSMVGSAYELSAISCIGASEESSNSVGLLTSVRAFITDLGVFMSEVGNLHTFFSQVLSDAFFDKNGPMYKQVSFHVFLEVLSPIILKKGGQFYSSFVTCLHQRLSDLFIVPLDAGGTDRTEVACFAIVGAAFIINNLSPLVMKVLDDKCTSDSEIAECVQEAFPLASSATHVGVTVLAGQEESVIHRDTLQKSRGTHVCVSSMQFSMPGIKKNGIDSLIQKCNEFVIRVQTKMGSFIDTVTPDAQYSVLKHRYKGLKDAEVSQESKEEIVSSLLALVFAQIEGLCLCDMHAVAPFAILGIGFNVSGVPPDRMPAVRTIMVLLGAFFSDRSLLILGKTRLGRHQTMILAQIREKFGINIAVCTDVSHGIDVCEYFAQNNAVTNAAIVIGTVQSLCALKLATKHLEGNARADSLFSGMAVVMQDYDEILSHNLTLQLRVELQDASKNTDILLANLLSYALSAAVNDSSLRPTIAFDGSLPDWTLMTLIATLYKGIYWIEDDGSRGVLVPHKSYYSLLRAILIQPETFLSMSGANPIDWRALLSLLHSPGTSNEIVQSIWNALSVPKYNMYENTLGFIRGIGSSAASNGFPISAVNTVSDSQRFVTLSQTRVCLPKVVMLSPLLPRSISVNCNVSDPCAMLYMVAEIVANEGSARLYDCHSVGSSSEGRKGVRANQSVLEAIPIGPRMVLIVCEHPSEARDLLQYLIGAHVYGGSLVGTLGPEEMRSAASGKSRFYIMPLQYCDKSSSGVPVLVDMRKWRVENFDVSLSHIEVVIFNVGWREAAYIKFSFMNYISILGNERALRVRGLASALDGIHGVRFRFLHCNFQQSIDSGIQRINAGDLFSQQIMLDLQTMAKEVDLRAELGVLLSRVLNASIFFFNDSDAITKFSERSAWEEKVVIMPQALLLHLECIIRDKMNEKLIALTSNVLALCNYIPISASLHTAHGFRWDGSEQKNYYRKHILAQKIMDAVSVIVRDSEPLLRNAMSLFAFLTFNRDDMEKLSVQRSWSEVLLSFSNALFLFTFNAAIWGGGLSGLIRVVCPNIKLPSIPDAKLAIDILQTDQPDALVDEIKNLLPYHFLLSLYSGSPLEVIFTNSEIQILGRLKGVITEDALNACICALIDQRRNMNGDVRGHKPAIDVALVQSTSIADPRRKISTGENDFEETVKDFQHIIPSSGFSLLYAVNACLQSSARILGLIAFLGIGEPISCHSPAMHTLLSSYTEGLGCVTIFSTCRSLERHKVLSWMKQHIEGICDNVELMRILGPYPKWVMMEFRNILQGGSHQPQRDLVWYYNRYCLLMLLIVSRDPFAEVTELDGLFPPNFPVSGSAFHTGDNASLNVLLPSLLPKIEPELVCKGLMTPDLLFLNLVKDGLDIMPEWLLRCQRLIKGFVSDDAFRELKAFMSSHPITASQGATGISDGTHLSKIGGALGCDWHRMLSSDGLGSMLQSRDMHFVFIPVLADSMQPPAVVTLGDSGSIENLSRVGKRLFGQEEGLRGKPGPMLSLIDLSSVFNGINTPAEIGLS